MKYPIVKGFKPDMTSGILSVKVLIGLAIGLIVMAYVMPGAIGAFYTASTTTWTINGTADTKTINLYFLLPFVAVAVLLYALIEEHV